jgi:replicative DNA helicase
MSNNLYHAAEQYRATGLSFIPVELKGKNPAISAWKDYQKRLPTIAEAGDMFRNNPKAEALAILTGESSGGLEVIDVDTKYDLTGRLWEQFSELINDNLPEIFPRLIIATTQSGGYHIYYRCGTIQGNQKLANRPATPEEAAKGEKVKVLLETRGTGGYVVAPPSKGYEFIQGTAGTIPTITAKDREHLLNMARSFDEMPAQEARSDQPPREVKRTGSSQVLSPFEDYNSRGEDHVLRELQGQGWRIVQEYGERVILRRPGETKSQSSGNYHTGLKRLKMFSTSTGFDTDKTYNNVDIYAMLNYGNLEPEAIKEAAKALYNEGYGDRRTKQLVMSNNATTAKPEPQEPTSQPTRETLTEAVRKAEKAGQGSFTYYAPQGYDRASLTAELQTIHGKTKLSLFIAEPATETTAPDILTAPEVLARELLQRYRERNTNTSQDRENLLHEAIAISAEIREPIRQRIFLTQIKNALNLQGDELDKAAERLQQIADQKAQAQDFDRLQKKAQELKEAGDMKGALELLITEGRELKGRDKAAEAERFLTPKTRTDIFEHYKNAPDGIRTGLTIGDQDIELTAGALSIIAAPTSHGKTTLLINLALRAGGLLPDKKILFLSMEESAEAVTISALNSFSKTTFSKGNRGSIEHYYRTGGGLKYIEHAKWDEFQAIEKKFFAEIIEPGRLLIQHNGGEAGEICGLIQQLNKKADIGAVFIDYLQLMRKSHDWKNGKGSRQEELKQVCLDLHDVAIETGLPFILGAQFNRVVNHPDKIHTTNIGEAGDIERIAHLIIGVWNSAHAPAAMKEDDKQKYLKEYQPKARVEGEPGLFVTILKNRTGAVGAEDFLYYNQNQGYIRNAGVSTPGAHILVQPSRENPF